MSTPAQEWANSRLRRPQQVQGAFAFLGNVQGRGGSFAFADVDANLVHEAIQVWVEQGYAISFGHTSDGGALGLHLVAGGVKRSLYGASVEEVEDHLRTIIGSKGAKPG